MRSTRSSPGFVPFDLARYVDTSFPGAQQSGDERVVDCFFCGKRRKLYINVVKRKFFCFRCGAGQGATLISFIRDHRNVSEREAWQILQSGLYTGIPTRSYEREFDALPRTKQRDTVLPTEYHPLYPLSDLEDAVLGQRAITYLRGRGLTDGDIILYQLGYCASGRYAGRIIVPVTRDKEVVYFMARLFFGYGQRYLNPRKDEVIANPADLIFNWDLAQDAEVLQLAEGVFDGIGLGDQAGALFGKRVHPGQLALLESGKFSSIELWLDSPAKDPAIRRDAEQMAFTLKVLGKPVTICTLAHGDPSDLKTQEIPVERHEGGQWTNYFRNRGSRR